MKKKIKMFGIIALAVVIGFTMSACDDSLDDVNEVRFPARFQVVPAWTENSGAAAALQSVNPALNFVSASGTTKEMSVIYSEYYQGYHNALIFLGHIDNVPITSGVTMYFDGRTPITVSRAQGELTSTTVSESVSRAVTETTSRTTVLDREARVNAGVRFAFFSAGADARIRETITNSTMTERSVSDTFSTAHTKTQQVTDTVSVTVGNRGEPAGRYRITLFATTDVYLTVRLDAGGNIVGEPEISVSARENSYTFMLDFDPNPVGDFGRTGRGEMLPIPDDFSFLLAQTTPRFVAIGPVLITINSPDGINWDGRTGPANLISMHRVKYINNRFMKVGSWLSYNFKVSRDGINWEARNIGNNTINNPTHLRSIAYFNNVYLAVGNLGHTTGAYGRIAHSRNGIDWTVSSVGNSTNNFVESWRDVSFGNDRWVVVGSSGRMAFTANPTGGSWSIITVGSGDWNSVTFANNIFVAVGNSGNIAYSHDGIHWNEITVNTSNWSSILFANGKFVVTGSTVGGFGRMAHSTDGINWSDIIVGTTGWNDVTYGEGLWVAVGGTPDFIGRMAHSTDGINWIERTVGTPGENYWISIAFGLAR